MDYDKIIKNIEKAKELEEKLGLVYLELAVEVKEKKPDTNALFMRLYYQSELNYKELERLRGGVLLEKFHANPKNIIGNKDN